MLLGGGQAASRLEAIAITNPSPYWIVWINFTSNSISNYLLLLVANMVPSKARSP